MTKARHHAGQFEVKARRMRQRATADPTATCWRDGLTLAQHPGQTWTCGHVDDPALYQLHPSRYADTIDGRLCAPEASGCNYSHGATAGNKRRGQATTRRW